MPLSATLGLHWKGLKCVFGPLCAFTYLSALCDLLTVSVPRIELITDYVTHTLSLVCHYFS